MSPDVLNTNNRGLCTGLHEEETLIRSAHFSGANGSEVVQRRTALIDRTLRDIHLHLCKSGPMPLQIAVGGYGRGELNPYSDIDVMYLYRSATERERAAEMLYRLWDESLNVGYSVRNLEECIELGRKDIKVRTSLMESRLISGDPVSYAHFLSVMRSEVFSWKTMSFIQEKIAERASVRRKYGGSIYLREPNVKEGFGGLRDIHTAFWIAAARFRIASIADIPAMGIVTPGQYRVLLRSRSFLWRVRNEMHYVSGRKNDHLTFDLQERSASDFGYRNSSHLLSVERFMKAYFIHAKNVSEFSSIVSAAVLRKKGWLSFAMPVRTKRIGSFAVINRVLIQTSDDTFERLPVSAFEAFELMKNKRYVFSDRLKTLIRQMKVGDDLRMSREAAGRFIAMLDNPDRLSETLMLMKDLRFLGKFIPEFRAIQALARHDYYHMYTVDEHIMLAIRSLEDLWNGRFQGNRSLMDAMRNLPRRYILMLAVLLHDLGKAFRTDHEIRSAEAAERVLDRLGIGGDIKERVLFLVRNHSLMSSLSQRRELSDGKVMAHLAGLVKDRENLDMLYLLTYADISAVSPSSWTQWKAALLQELYIGTVEYLEWRRAVADDPQERFLRKIREVKKASQGLFTPGDVEEILSVLPKEYITATSPQKILLHMSMLKRLASEGLVISHRHVYEKGITELTVLAYDAYGMLSRTAGTLASKNLNIVRAKAFTTKNGVMIDTFHITDADGGLMAYEDTWASIEDDIRRALTGPYKPPQFVYHSGEKPAIDVETSVEFDNVSSDIFTIIDITARDRVGLLYRISRTLYELNIDIASAKIATEGAKAMDSFYITDLLKNKITDPVRMKNIKEALLKVLA